VTSPAAALILTSLLLQALSTAANFVLLDGSVVGPAGRELLFCM